jgi:outer membrane protein TolC
VAAALADRLPALRLTASTGYSAAEASDLFDDLLWNIAGNLLGPVLDGGRRRAEAERSRAVARERLARCAEVLLNAMREVEDALINERKLSETLERQTEQHEVSRQTLQQALSRYQRGLSDYLPVLTALAREQSIARALAETRRERLSYRIQLHRSLGGGWMQLEVGNAALTGGEKAHE